MVTEYLSETYKLYKREMKYVAWLEPEMKSKATKGYLFNQIWEGSRKTSMYIRWNQNYFFGIIFTILLRWNQRLPLITFTILLITSFC